MSVIVLRFFITFLHLFKTFLYLFKTFLFVVFSQHRLRGPVAVRGLESRAGQWGETVLL
jgi:hypothetical protein